VTASWISGGGGGGGAGAGGNGGKTDPGGRTMGDSLW
jgi:hypothetical protein